MAVLDDLLQKVSDPVLRDRLTKEIHKATKHKKFGLVFEEHLPECTLLYDVPVKIGSRVAVRDTEIKETFTVLSVEDGAVKCVSNDDKEPHEFPLNDLVTVAEFGEPIYPYLQTIDTVCNAPNSDLWHTLIEADNYHALQLLEYMYAGMVDCIYIDPPYNKEDSKDWKYNCNYVDGNDMYRHSKWLSMMERRLKLAKKLLNPKDSVLIVTIDEKEYLHLGMLLEQIFPNVKTQMISNVINPKGNRRDNEFSRCEEYIYFLYFGSASVVSNGSDMLRTKSEDNEEPDYSVRLRALLRGASNHGKRTDRPNLFYPLLFEKDTWRFVGHGPVLSIDENKDDYIPPDGTVAMWPIGANGTELTWNLQPTTLMEKHRKHFLSFGQWTGSGRTGYYLSSGQEANFYNGLYNIIGRDDEGAYIIELKHNVVKDTRPMTIWHKKEHSASEYGTTLLNSIIGSNKFPFPKSVYAVKDTIGFFVKNKPNALIVDFFAGSGTTLHATNLLNAEDNGHRRCIMVTNNEVGEKTEKRLKKQGLRPGDAEWEKMGIAKIATWPRTVCSIEGHDVNGKPLKGKYLGLDTSMSDGFKANAIYFKLGFLDKNAVSLGTQFKELLSVLWMKAGSVGPCPHLDERDVIPDMLILPQNRMAVLIDDTAFALFEERMKQHPEIETVYIVTDSDRGYREMLHALGAKNTYQLYRDYLDNFRINNRR